MPRRILHLIAGARPNFMKIAPLYHALSGVEWAVPRFIHTGQHYSQQLSDDILHDLGLPAPYRMLGVGSGSHAAQTARVMEAYDALLDEETPDAVIVPGDVNSSVAAALTAAKRHIPVVHLEAGLRSGDRTMPEEINRVVIDAISDLLWTPSADADENLLREGRHPGIIDRVGNIMLDSFEMQRGRIESESVWRELGLTQGEYGVVTLHRPANVDDRNALDTICASLERLGLQLPLIMPMHPRTQANIRRFGMESALCNVAVVEPLSYVRFMNLVLNSRLIITDSGGIQEETTYLGIPCLTLRPNTERPVTVTCGTNRLCTADTLEYMAVCALSQSRECVPPELWDGRTAERCIASLDRFFRQE